MKYLIIRFSFSYILSVIIAAAVWLFGASSNNTVESSSFQLCFHKYACVASAPERHAHNLASRIHSLISL